MSIVTNSLKVNITISTFVIDKLKINKFAVHYSFIKCVDLLKIVFKIEYFLNFGVILFDSDSEEQRLNP